MKELGETQEAVDTLYYNLQVRCDSTHKMTGMAAKSEPIDSVANREIRQQANREKRMERRAARAKASAEYHASLAASSAQEEASSSSSAPSESN